MLLTLFLAIVFCAAITLMLLSAVAFIQDKRFFSSAPKEAQAVIQPREQELFRGARAMGWVLMGLAITLILGTGLIAALDGIRNGFTFRQFFLRFVLIFTLYKLYDMVFFDYFLLVKFRFFQFYYPEVAPVYENRKYGYNLRSQLMKLFVIFPAVSALAAKLCTLL
ncbi:MAG: hypothetical protein IJ088_11725 [Clostridia bacterium]|nr:hypothetical protein [Clostridia bacterium]